MFEAIIEILILVVFIYIAKDAYGKLQRGRGGKVTDEGWRLMKIALVVGVFAFFAVWDLLNNSLVILWVETEKLSLRIFEFLPVRNSIKPILLISLVLLASAAIYLWFVLKKRNQNIGDVLGVWRKDISKTDLSSSKRTSRKSSSKYLTLSFLDKFDKAVSEDNLRELCFDLRIEYENLSGDNKRAKMRSLLELLDRESRMEVLINRLQNIRPNVHW
ncbi:MAG: hypothetical protein R3D55_23760 [Chloroflexota bacterium]